MSPDVPPADGSPRWYRLPVAGVIGAVVLGASALSPSLLPRSGAAAGLVAGVAAAVGYALGVLVEWITRRPTGRRGPWQVGRGARRGLAAVGVLAVGAMLVADQHWQDQLQAGVGQPPSTWTWYPITLAAGMAAFALLLGMARGIRRLTRWAVGLCRRLIPDRRARLAVGGATVLLLGAGLASGALAGALYAVMAWPFRSLDAETAAGVTRPTTTPVSGSDASGIPWDELGRNGRAFVATAPSRAQLEAFSGSAAMDPIRAFVGLGTSTDPQQRAELAVAELERLGGFSRRVLLVAGSAGSGIVDGSGISPVEYMYGGDTATVSTQYSYLPSWMSFLADQQASRDAGRALYDAVYRRWSQLPAQERPLLLAFGESLGAFGAEAAFTGPADMVDRSDGLLFAGPPAASPLHAQMTRDREPGSLQRTPVYDQGAHVRFAGMPSDLDHPASTWENPRLVYLQNATDPVTWWSPTLAWSRPDWLAEPPGPGVSPALRWLPLVTFLELSGDMVNSTSVPYGFGHVYGPNQAAAWARIAAPPGWTQADTDRLVALG